MKRVVIVGVTGTGKTTLGQNLAARLGMPFVDLDALHWRPNWQEAPDDEFRQSVNEALQGERWVVAGNYSKARDVIWPRADTLIWLDYPLWFIMWRLLRRTTRRIITQEDLWGTGNRETWRQQFFSRDSLFIWAWKSYPRRRREYPKISQQFPHLKMLRFRSHRQMQHWFDTLEEQKEAQHE